MKLEVGMWVRTKDGFLDEVVIEYKGYCNNPNCNRKHVSCKHNYYDEDEIVKASRSLLGNDEEPCLIEAGDYVNGWKVLYWTDGTKIIDDGLTTDLNKVDIKSIVTKEQFESMSYKVEG